MSGTYDSVEAGAGACPALMAPMQLGAWHLPNRVVMAPMTRSRAGAGEAATASTARYYAQRATAGLIVAEASQVSAEGQGYLRTPGIHTRAQVEGWRLVTEAVHARGGRIVLQLWHVGRVSHPDNRPAGARSVAPTARPAAVRIFTSSGMWPAGTPQCLTTNEVAGVAADYARAARNALEAGFDGVELHGANGYLVDQFLQGSSNDRTDRYGGSAENRCRFLFETVDCLGEAIGAERVGVRLSPFGVFNDVRDEAPAELFATAMRGLSERRLAYLHVINPEVSGDRTRGEAGVDVPAFAREHYRGTLMVAGGYTPESGDALLRAGKADLVAFGRPFISNPDFVDRVRRGLPLAPSDRATYYTEGDRGYTDYPDAEGAHA